MKFLIDENIRKEVREFVHSLGYDVRIAPGGCSDREIAETAKAEKRIILTHDIHFSNILAYPPQEFLGIIRIKIHPPDAEIIINALKHLFQKLSASQIEKRLIVLEEGGFRIR